MVFRLSSFSVRRRRWSRTRADYQIGAVFQLVDLALHAGAAVDSHGLYLSLEPGKLPDLVTSLHRQFPCGAKDQSAHIAALLLGHLSHLFQDRDAECSSFSRAGIGLSDHVFALQQQRNRLFLDLCHLGEVQLCNRLQQWCG